MVDTRAAVDEAAVKYDRGHGGEARGQEVAAQLHPHLAPGPVLDVGAATGLVALGLRSLGHSVLALDRNRKLLTGALPRLGPAVMMADAQALPFRSGALGNALYVHVWHELPDIAGALVEARRILRPGGRILGLHGVPQAELGDMREAFEPLRPLSLLRDEAERLDPLAAGAGLRLVARQLVTAFTGGMTPNRYAASIEGRVWGYLSEMDSDTWARVVVPVVAALRALPEPDAPRQLVWRLNLSVYSA